MISLVGFQVHRQACHFRFGEEFHLLDLDDAPLTVFLTNIELEIDTSVEVVEEEADVIVRLLIKAEDAEESVCRRPVWVRDGILAMLYTHNRTEIITRDGIDI